MGGRPAVSSSTTGAADVQVACRDCGEAFLSTVAERASRRAGGFGPMVRCPACRVRRRDERNALALAGYATATPATRPSRAPSAGVEPDSGFRAVCAACGRETVLPFRPRDDRPVYCRSCLDRRAGR